MRKTEFIGKMSHWLGQTRHCSKCQKAMQEISDKMSRGHEVTLVLRPDKNDFGNITHHHIEFINSKELK